MTVKSLSGASMVRGPDTKYLIRDRQPTRPTVWKVVATVSGPTRRAIDWIYNENGRVDCRL
jgi:hypothetical protein